MNMSGVRKTASPLRAGASFVVADSGTIQASRPSGTNSARQRTPAPWSAGPANPPQSAALVLRPGRNHPVGARVRDRLPQMLVLIFENQQQRFLLRLGGRRCLL